MNIQYAISFIRHLCMAFLLASVILSSLILLVLYKTEKP